MLYGMRDPADEEMPKCPVCRDETNDLYESEDGEILGCPSCLYEVPEDAKLFGAWEWWKELQEVLLEEHYESVRGL